MPRYGIATVGLSVRLPAIHGYGRYPIDCTLPLWQAALRNLSDLGFEPPNF